jgi:hypothetical protein
MLCQYAVKPNDGALAGGRAAWMARSRAAPKPEKYMEAGRAIHAESEQENCSLPFDIYCLFDPDRIRSQRNRAAIDIHVIGSRWGQTRRTLAKRLLHDKYESFNVGRAGASTRTELKHYLEYKEKYKIVPNVVVLQ